MTRAGRCACGAVRFRVDGPVRDVIVCHCGACRKAAGGPWAASAAYRSDLSIDDGGALVWEKAAQSAHGASRGTCRRCKAYLFWDAPGRETVSFAAALLDDGGCGLEVAAHIWVAERGGEAVRATGVPVVREGLPGSLTVRWRDDTSRSGGSGGGGQPELARDRLECRHHVRDVLVELEPE